MSDFQTLLAGGNAWLFLPSAILLGALHGLEPGHSKTMMAAFIVAVRGTVAQAVMLGLAATLSHTAVVWIVALGGMYFGQRWSAEATEPWMQLISGVIVVSIALWMFWRVSQDKAACFHDHGAQGHGQGASRGGFTTKPKRPSSAIGRSNGVGNQTGGRTVQRGSGAHTARRSLGNGDDDDDDDDDAANGIRRDENGDDDKDDELRAFRREIDAVRRKQNQELLEVLQQEHHAEEQREFMLAKAMDMHERARMAHIFDQERAKASDRIMKLTQSHERGLADRMDHLR